MVTGTTRRSSCSVSEERATSQNPFLGGSTKTSRRSALRSSGRVLSLDSIPLNLDTPSIDLDVTTGCNLACAYCFKNLGRADSMPLETAQSAVDWVLRASGPHKRISVNFMGGEPLLVFPMLRKLVNWGNRRCKELQKEIGWSLTTNMTLMNDEIRRWVDQKGLGVLMSIDGVPEVQEEQRPSKDGKPKSDIIKKWAKSMLRTRPRSDARATLSPQWVHRLYESCLYLWEEIGFTSVMFAETGYEYWTEDHLREYRLQLQKVVQYLVADFRRGGQKSLAMLSFITKKLVIPRDEGKAIPVRVFPCGAGYNYMMIDSKGTIWPCHRCEGAAKETGTEAGMRLGNLYSSGFDETLSNAFRNFNHPETSKPMCSICPFDPVCAGGCPAANLSSTGSIYTPHDTFCKLKWIAYEQSVTLYQKMKTHDSVRCHQFFENVNERWKD